MRELMFRGKTISDERWVISDSIRQENERVYLYDEVKDIDVEVNPETVGQYTGLTDKNGVNIFEGDIVVYRGDEYGVIEYDVEIARFCVTFDTWITDFDHLYGKEIEVIGKIHDNKDLLQ